MQLFLRKRFSVIHCLVLVLLAYFIVSPAQAGQLYNIHIGWVYDVSQNIPFDRFRLYQENNVICQSQGPDDRTMDCIFESEPGTFNFYLSAYSDNGESPLSVPFPFTLQEIISPVVEISSNISSGELPITVTFTAEASQGSITRYNWSFGDGSADTWSTENQVTHTYYIAGQYTASVTGRDLNNNRDTNSLTIEVTPQNLPPDVTAPTAAIRSSLTTGAGPFSVSFDGLTSAASNGEISQCIWNFDDNSQRIYNPTAVHIYSIPGIYHPTLTVIDSQGIVHSTSVTIVVTDYVQNNNSPDAAFTCSLVQLDDALVLEFDASPSNDSDGQITDYIWNFGNSAFTSGTQVTHTFPANRVCNISLTVTDDSGSQHTSSMSTITFLKDIHAAVIYHINSILLK